MSSEVVNWWTVVLVERCSNGLCATSATITSHDRRTAQRAAGFERKAEMYLNPSPLFQIQCKLSSEEPWLAALHHMTAMLIVRSRESEPLQMEEKKAIRTAGLIAHEETGLWFEMTTTAAVAAMQTTVMKASSIAGHGDRELLLLYLPATGANPLAWDICACFDLEQIDRIVIESRK
jgi:hypothetical protein